MGRVLLTIMRDGWTARLRNWFPEREFIVRSHGRLRFITVSGKLQATAAAIVSAVALAWLTTMTVMLATQFESSAERAALLAREARVAGAEARVAAYRDGADKLASRQRFLEAVVETRLGELGDAAVTPAAAIDSGGVKTIGALFPRTLGLAEIESRQLALAERLTELTDARAASAERAIRRVGLNPRLLAAHRGDRLGQGGPLLALAGRDEAPGSAFARLGVSLTRLSALEHGLEAIPSHLPASLEFISSGFGYRSDPITGEAAMHSGLDFRGPIGAPVHAAADGSVSFAGVKSGYGNCLEISHGNGMVTRYAHLSAFKARVGEKVAAGQVVAAIGNTGRSTGPHLHFEVRINDHAVNPRPFLQAA
ncbi:MAG TPA: M23 family metallopeptidase [Novosphingobium sp.]|nr:M23 family metallopeptidase [Novosphingobium sp.]